MSGTNFFMRYTTILIFIAFLVAGVSFWFYHAYSMCAQFFSENIFYCLICMGFWHYYVNNLARNGKSAIDSKTFFFWVIPVLTAITWLIVGVERMNNCWVQWFFDFCWALNMSLPLIMCFVKVSKDKGKDDIKKLAKDFSTWFLVINSTIGAKVICVLIFTNILGFARDNIIEFIINVALYLALVYPWGTFYN